MRVHRGIPLSWLITTVIVATVILVAGAGFGLLAANQVRVIRERQVTEAQQTAQLLAMFAAVDLMFDAHDQAEKDLAMLRGHPDMESAWLYDRNGRQFAAWRRPMTVPPMPPPVRQHAPGSALPTTRWISSEFIEVQAPIRDDDRHVGTLQLLVSTRQVREQLHSLMITLAVLGLGVLALSLVVAPLL